MLAKNRRDALRLAATKGVKETKRMMEDAAADLRKRLAQVVTTGAGDDSFTAAQMRATLAQVEEVVRDLTDDLKTTVVSQGVLAATKGSEGVIDYLNRADRMFRGVGRQPLALKEASMLDFATKRTEASILRRLSVNDQHPAQGGILARYGTETIGEFEKVLQQAMIQKKPWAEVRLDLIQKSPFLQGSPMYWTERIVRTETIGAYNRSGWETTRKAQEALGDMLKILCATFDNRTAADSYAVHGQIRRVDEAFQTWQGLVQSPPARPNDREIVVPHRMSWPIPAGLEWKTDGEVAARWAYEGRRGSPPPRPKMTTVPLNQIGV